MFWISSGIQIFIECQLSALWLKSSLLTQSLPISPNTHTHFLSSCFHLFGYILSFFSHLKAFTHIVSSVWNAYYCICMADCLYISSQLKCHFIREIPRSLYNITLSFSNFNFYISYLCLLTLPVSEQNDSIFYFPMTAHSRRLSFQWTASHKWELCTCCNQNIYYFQVLDSRFPFSSHKLLPAHLELSLLKRTSTLSQLIR